MPNGDHFMCGKERALWSLHQEIILRWGVFTMFRWERMHVGKMQDECIYWFVPREAPECFEIIKGREYELEKEEREPEEDWPGCQVHIQVMECECLDPYIDRDINEVLCKKYAKMFQDKIQKALQKRKEEKEKENGDKDKKEKAG
jgi:hypothetical protein